MVLSAADPGPATTPETTRETDAAGDAAPAGRSVARIRYAVLAAATLFVAIDAGRIELARGQIEVAAEAAAYAALVYGRTETAYQARAHAYAASDAALPEAWGSALREGRLRFGAWDAERGALTEGRGANAVVVESARLSDALHPFTAAVMGLIRDRGWDVVRVAAIDASGQGRPEIDAPDVEILALAGGG